MKQIKEPAGHDVLNSKSSFSFHSTSSSQPFYGHVIIYALFHVSSQEDDNGIYLASFCFGKVILPCLYIAIFSMILLLDNNKNIWGDVS